MSSEVSILFSCVSLHPKTWWSQPGVVANACDPSPLEAEAGGLPRVQGQPGLPSETLSDKK